jgi:Na+/proline symporter
MTPSLIGAVAFVSYLVLVLLIGWLASRGQASSEDFWVAGRRFGVPLLVMGNVAAMLHGGAILSHIGFAAHAGGVAITNNLSYALGFAVIFFFFAAKLRRSRGFTLPDYLGDRFRSRLLRGWAALVVASTSVIYLVAQIRAMGFVLDRLLGVEVWSGQLLAPSSSSRTLRSEACAPSSGRTCSSSLSCGPDSSFSRRRCTRRREASSL